VILANLSLMDREDVKGRLCKESFVLLKVIVYRGSFQIVLKHFTILSSEERKCAYIQ